MSEQSKIQHMLNETAAYQGKQAPDPEVDRGNARQELGNPKLEPPPHMADPSLGGGYVTDNAAATRARNAQTDKNLSTVPPARKP